MKKLLSLLLFVSLFSFSSCSSESEHIHNYSEWETTKNATCTDDGEASRFCSCGDTQIKNIASKGHDWKNATCESAKTCKVCKIIEGEALGHYYIGLECVRCGNENQPNVSVEIECPETLAYYYGYSGENQSKCTITNISYQFNNANIGFSLDITYDITKTYDVDGAFGNTPIRFKYILYGSDGSIAVSGDDFDYNIVVGQKKSGQTISLKLSSIDSSYRIVFMNYRL